MKALRCWTVGIWFTFWAVLIQHEAIDSHHPFLGSNVLVCCVNSRSLSISPIPAGSRRWMAKIKEMALESTNKMKSTKCFSCPHWLTYNGAPPFQVYRYRKSSRSVLALKLPATTVFCPPDSWFIVRKEVCWPPKKARCRLESRRKKDTYYLTSLSRYCIK